METIQVSINQRMEKEDADCDTETTAILLTFT
jgi:hypothetical protein